MSGRERLAGFVGHIGASSAILCGRRPLDAPVLTVLTSHNIGEVRSDSPFDRDAIDATPDQLERDLQSAGIKPERRPVCEPSENPEVQAVQGATRELALASDRGTTQECAAHPRSREGSKPIAALGVSNQADADDRRHTVDPPDIDRFAMDHSPPDSIGLAQLALPTLRRH